jgi:hypothetical protein
MNELTLFAGVTILYTAIAMWSTQPSYSCVMSEEPRQRLYMDREVDREHLDGRVGSASGSSICRSREQGDHRARNGQPMPRDANATVIDQP